MLQAKVAAPALDGGVRFYLIPGYGHGRGVFNAGFDALGVLDQWLDGSAPTKLTVDDNDHPRTRPLCAFPSYPRFVAGDANLAASFTCAVPE